MPKKIGEYFMPYIPQTNHGPFFHCSPEFLGDASVAIILLWHPQTHGESPWFWHSPRSLPFTGPHEKTLVDRRNDRKKHGSEILTSLSANPEKHVCSAIPIIGQIPVIPKPELPELKGLRRGLPWLNHNWLVVSTHLKNISQMGNLPQIVVKKQKHETTT